MPIQVEDSNEYAHVKWIETKPGQLTECAVMKTDEYGNMYFFPVADLDMIDRRRLLKVLTDRHAKTMPLWDLMSQKTLGNGMNALNYFHQLVKIITPEGKIINPRAGVIGRSAGTRSVNPATNPADDAPAAEV